MTPRSPPPPLAPSERPDLLPFAEAAGRVMVRQVGSFLRGRRLLGALLLAAIPPAVALLFGSADPVSLVRVLVQIFLPFLLPLVAISLGSGLLHDEAEEGTLTYLFTAPLPRAAVLLGKWAAALALGWALLLLSLGAVLLSSPVDAEATAPLRGAAVGAAFLGYPAYLGLFTLLGTLFRRGFLAGLIYTFGYELVIGFVPGAAKRFSVNYFLKSLLEPHAAEKTPFQGAFLGLGSAGETTCLAVLLSIALASLFLSLLLVHRKEFQARNVQA